MQILKLYFIIWSFLTVKNVYGQIWNIILTFTYSLGFQPNINLIHWLRAKETDEMYRWLNSETGRAFMKIVQESR